MNAVLETDFFRELYDSCEVAEQRRIDRIKDQLAVQLRVGKPLHYQWLREKRIEGNRLYYIINEATKKALLVAYGSKRQQQRIINEIIAQKFEYQRLLA